MERNPKAGREAGVLPRLERVCRDGVCVWTDTALDGSFGIVVAFTERGGGVSGSPFGTLNLAQHVGDHPSHVDENRRRLLDALGISTLAERLVTADQVHGARVHHVNEGDAGAGASTSGIRPIEGTDALVTTEVGIPLLLFFADCVPVVLVASDGQRGIAVAHAGWRGAQANIAERVAERLCAVCECDAASLVAYLGPHIGPCHYEVGSEVLSHFRGGSDTIAQAPGPLDLGAHVSADLERIGVRRDRIASLERCTAEHTDQFYSHRAETRTGRHGALAVIREVQS